MKKNTTPLLKGDIIIIICVLSLALAIFLLTVTMFNTSNQSSELVEIYLNNEKIHSLHLYIDETILVNDIYQNTIVIENNQVRVIHSTCPDGICENFGSISSPSQSIICMPNKLIIKISGESNTQLDVIV